MTIPPLARILIVDDEAANLQALCDTLRDQGYETAGCSSAEDALQALQRAPFDLLLTDLEMPGMDGVALLAAAQALDAQLVGIIMTGKGTIQTAVQAMQSGALDYVLKPLRMGNLVPVLARALGIRRLRQENVELRGTVAIQEFTLAIAHTLDPLILLEKVADAAVSQFEADEVSLMLVAEQTNELFVAAVRGAGREALLGSRVPIGEGIAGWVCARHEPLVLNGNVDDPRFAPVAARAEIRSSMCMPMLTRNRLIGVINVNNIRRQQLFSIGQIKMLSILASAAAAGIDAARLHQQERRSAERHRILADISQGLADVSLDHRATLDLLARRLAELIGDLCVVHIFSDSQLWEEHTAIHHPDVETTRVWSAAISRSSKHGDGGLAERVIRAGETVLIPVLASDDRHRLDVLNWPEQAVVHSVLIVPLRVQERIIGYIAMIRDTASQCYGPDEQGLLQEVADRAAMTITGARLFNEMESLVAARTVELSESRNQLRDSIARIEAIIRTIRDGIITIDEQGVIETVNPAAERIFGYARGEMIGSNIRASAPESHRNLLEQYLAHDHNGSKAGFADFAGDLHGLRKDGSEFPMELAVNGMWLGGQRHFVGVVRDITTRKQTETALLAAKLAAELANQRKDSFLATMSHEIRTPLGGLSGMLEVLSLTPLDSEQRELLQGARDSAHSLLRILNDILDWSKIEAGRLDLDPRPASIKQLVTQVANTYARVASARSVILQQSVDERISPAHIVDPLRLSQIMNNFLSNAIKFSPRGRVDISAELLAHHDDAQVIRLSVRDTGIGIDEDAQQRLFQSYGQAGADTARMYGGTGLGLAISRRLADLLGGHIAVQSAPGRGSTFSITLALPLADEPADQESHSPKVEQIQPLHDSPREQAPRILLVDDHPVNRRLLVLQLGLLGLRAEAVDTGEKALERWRAGGIAALITDCHMPGTDGYALTREIRRIEAGEARPRTPVIAWTANALAEESDKCRAAGMDDLLVKPAELPRLHRVLSKWLQGAPGVAADGTADLPRPEPNPQPIDLRVLENLVGGDSCVVRELLFEFRSSAERIAGELQPACAHARLDQVVALAHKLKSSARSVGALGLGEICEHLERSASTRDSLAVRTLLPRFEAELGAVLDRINNELND